MKNRSFYVVVAVLTASAIGAWKVPAERAAHGAAEFASELSTHRLNDLEDQIVEYADAANLTQSLAGSPHLSEAERRALNVRTYEFKAQATSAAETLLAVKPNEAFELSEFAANLQELPEIKRNQMLAWLIETPME